MKTLLTLATTLLIATGSLHADPWRHGGWGYGPALRSYHSADGWVAPLVIGGFLGYALSRPAVVYESRPAIVYTTQPTVVVQPSAPVIQQVSYVTSEPPLYEERWVYFDDCQCERKVLVSIRR